METDSAEPCGENNSFPTQTAPNPLIVAVNTNVPSSPTLAIEIEPAESAPPLPRRKRRMRGQAPSKKAKMLDLPLTSTPHGSTSTSIATPRRPDTSPIVPTPQFVTRRLSPLAPRAANLAPQSQSQKPKTPPAFPLPSVFRQAAESQVAPSQSLLLPLPPANQPLPSARPSSPPATQSQMPVQLSTPRPSISATSDDEGKDEGERKGFDPLLLQAVVEEKENTKKAGQNKPAINRLFAVPATSEAASLATVPPTSTLLNASTPFGSTSLGTRIGGFGPTKIASFGVSGFGANVGAAARPTPLPATGGFKRSSVAGAGAGFATFGTGASGSGSSAIDFEFAPAASTIQMPSFPIQARDIVYGESDDDDEQDRDSNTNVDDELGVDTGVELKCDLNSTRLPMEIFREVFLYCIEANQMKPGQLASVCRYWRSVITSIASLWSTLRVGTWTETERVATWLQRAYPKKVVLDTQRDRKIPSVGPAFAALHNALTSTSQWHELTISSFPPENFAIQLGVQSASPMSVLRVLDVSAECVNSPSFSHLLNLVPTKAPLTELRLHPSFANIPFLQPRWFSVLQNLTVLIVNGRDILSHFSFFLLLPSLRYSRLIAFVSLRMSRTPIFLFSLLFVSCGSELVQYNGWLGDSSHASRSVPSSFLASGGQLSSMGWNCHRARNWPFMVIR